MGRKSDAKSRLLHAATVLIHDRGYTAVGINEICKEAGVQKGSFYYFFKTKVDLAMAVIEHIAAVEKEETQAMLQDKGSPVQRLEQRIEKYIKEQVEIQASTGHVMGCPLGNLILEMSTQEEVLRERLAAVMDDSIHGFESLIQQGIELGVWPKMDSKQTANAIIQLIEGAFIIAKMRNDTASLNSLIQSIHQQLGTTGT